MTIGSATARGVQVAVVLASLAIGAVPTYAKKPLPAPPAVAVVVSPPAPLDVLVDARSPNVANVARIELPGRVVFAGRVLSFAARGDQLAVKSTPERDAGQLDTEMLPVPKLPALVTFAFHGADRYGVAVRRDPATGGISVGSAYGATVKIGGATGTVIDCDRDGVLGSAGDGVVVPGCRTIAPWCGELWTADGAVTLVATELAKAPKASPIPMPHPDDPDHSACWRHIQWRRQQVAVRPVAYDATYEPDMRAHARYMIANGRRVTHDEVKGNPGYSDAGALAGPACSIGPARSSVDGFELQVWTLFHRQACLNAVMLSSTIYFEDGMWEMRVHGKDSITTPDDVVVFPPHGMTDVNPALHGETPMPLTVPPGTHLGLAIGVRHRSWVGLKTPVAPELTLAIVRSATKLEPYTAGVLGAPGRAPEDSQLYDRQGLVAFVATSPLPPATLFRAHVVVPRLGIDHPPPFVYDWEFTTGTAK